MVQESIGRLAATPRTLAHLVAEVDDARLDATQGDAWSARTILAHLRDAEFLEMRLGLERMLAEHEPRLVFLPAPGWADSRSRARDRKEWLLGDFALQRQASVGILRALGDADWLRTGRIGDRPPMTVTEFLAFWVRHDATHVAQLETTLGESLSDVLARRARPG